MSATKVSSSTHTKIYAILLGCNQFGIFVNLLLSLKTIRRVIKRNKGDVVGLKTCLRQLLSKICIFNSLFEVNNVCLNANSIHSKSEKFCGVCFLVTKKLRKKCVNLDIQDHVHYTFVAFLYNTFTHV